MPGSPTTRVPLLHRCSDVLRGTCGRQAAHGLQHTQTDAAWPVLAVLSCAGRQPVHQTAHSGRQLP